MGARALWGHKLKGRRVLWLSDNEIASFALTAMPSSVAASADSLWSIADLEISLQTLSWYERVPTASNLFDGSRCTGLCCHECGQGDVFVWDCQLGIGQLESVLSIDAMIFSSIFLGR